MSYPPPAPPSPSGGGQPGSPLGGGSPYGSPPPPPPPERGNRTGLWVAIACGVLLLLVVVVGAGGVGAWLLLREPDDGPTTTAAQDPTDDAADEPTAEPTGEPNDEPTGEPTDDPTDQTDTASLTLRINSSEEVDEVETDDGPLEPANGAFVGVEIELTNESAEEIGLAGENFTFYDEDGNSYHVRYGRFSTAGPQIPPGETATARVYADVEPGTAITRVSYTDDVATGGQEVTLPIE